MFKYYGPAIRAGKYRVCGRYYREGDIIQGNKCYFINGRRWIHDGLDDIEVFNIFKVVTKTIKKRGHKSYIEVKIKNIEGNGLYE